MSESTVTGRCFCGRVRFVVRGPEKFACFCHCESCQRAAGAPLVAWATYERDTFSVTQGKIRYYRSSPGVIRGFCSNCGSSITYENEKRLGEVDITINTFDEPALPTPRAHIWTEDKQPWLHIADDLPVYEKNIG